MAPALQRKELMMKKKAILYAAVALLLLLDSPVHARRQMETKEVIVKAGDVYQEISFPEGTELTLGVVSNYVVRVVLSADFEMNGHLILKGTMLGIKGKNLFEIWPEEGQKINDMEFKENEAHIRFREDGSVENIHLEKEKEIQKIRWGENNWLEFYPNGKVSEGILADDQSFKGLNMKGRTELSFYSDGQIKGAKIASTSNWQNYVIKGEDKFSSVDTSDVDFWPNGKIKNALLAQELKEGTYYCGNGAISFYESGKLESCVLSREVLIRKRDVLLRNPNQDFYEELLEVGTTVSFNEDGVATGWMGVRHQRKWLKILEDWTWRAISGYREM